MATTQSANIIRTESEARQIARTLHFPMAPIPLALHINWESIAQTARELGAHFEARYAQDGACTITMFWAYTEDEIELEQKHLLARLQPPPYPVRKRLREATLKVGRKA